MKKSKFNGKIRTWEGLVFGTLESGDSVIIANSITNAKALVGCMVEYEPVDCKTSDKIRIGACFKIVSIQL